MGLSRKTFLYSIALAVIMTAFVIGYFVLMLPSLYVDYVMDSNLDSVVQAQQSYMENRTYRDVAVKNPSSVFSAEIPKEGNEIYLSGKFFKVTVRVKDEELQKLLDDTRSMAAGAGNKAGRGPADTQGHTGTAAATKLMARWKDVLNDKFAGQELVKADYPVEFEAERIEVPGIYKGEYTKTHFVSGNILAYEDGVSDGNDSYTTILVYENGVSDGNYSYTTYTAVGWTEDAFIMTVMPTMTPQMGEITPIVRASLPMIAAVVFLLVLLSSRFFAGRIVHPIIRLADYAENAGVSGNFGADGFAVKSNDEIGMLGRNLQELYGKLHDNYEELERKNHILEEENERQEVFMRASSHQLKTPVAAALLLVEGMMNEVGKYKDTKAYLPEVKKQLLSMQKIVEDILYLHHCAGNMQIEDVDLRLLAQEAAGSYAVQAESRGVCMGIEGEGTVAADREMLRIVADNLISNAVQYTPGRQKIVIKAARNELCVINYGVTIEKEMLPNIFEPFVSSDISRKGRGLGLYVASYYCRRMGCRLKICNLEDGVEARVSFPEGPGLLKEPGQL